MLLLLLDMQPMNTPTINDDIREVKPNMAEMGKYFAIISFTLRPSYIKELPKSKEKVLLSMRKYRVEICSSSPYFSLIFAIIFALFIKSVSYILPGTSSNKKKVIVLIMNIDIIKITRL